MEFRKSVVQPVILIGMHRSGTSMIARLLENMGLYVGNVKDDNNESLFFFDLNNWIFRVGVARADLPGNLEFMNDRCKQEVVHALDYHLGGPLKKKYLGGHKFSDIRDIDFPWGWKDPKNTFTLDHYKELFPMAKVIHIYRNPIDAVQSYMKRDLNKRNEFHLTWKKKFKRRFLVAHKYHQNFRLQNLSQGYMLWQEYVSKAISWEAGFGERMMSLKYEDFLDSPDSKLKELALFCGLATSEADIISLSKGVDTSRKYAFFSNAGNMAFYEEIKNDPLMVRLGYQDLV